MIFNIRTEIINKFQLNRNKSAAVLFIVDSKSMKNELAATLNELGIELNKIQLEKFLKKDETELISVLPKGKPDLMLIKKINADKSFNQDFFRNYLSDVIQKLNDYEIDNLQLQIPDEKKVERKFPSYNYCLQTIAEGIYLGNYNFNIYKSDKKKPKNIMVSLITGDAAAVKTAFEKGKNIIESVSFARDMINEPAITLTPQEMYIRSKKELTKHGIKVNLFDKKKLTQKKMNAILAVGNASANPPLLMIMRYKPSVKPKRKIALVGKGVTYDTGGLSIKPTLGMNEMNADMAGAGTVVGIMIAAAKLKLPVELIGVTPLVENMISGGSYKPGDVVKTSSGKSIEVKDTDAEGRIVLADALEFASKEKPDEIIDFATLTGAVAVALGLFIAGVFSRDEELITKLVAAGNKTHERLWAMPFFDDYNDLIKSDIADVSNLGPRWGGAITAGKFLEHFVDKSIPWAHIDLAGPALKHKSTSYTEKYNTAFGVRLIVDYLQTI